MTGRERKTLSIFHQQVDARSPGCMAGQHTGCPLQNPHHLFPRFLAGQPIDRDAVSGRLVHKKFRVDAQVEIFIGPIQIRFEQVDHFFCEVKETSRRNIILGRQDFDPIEDNFFAHGVCLIME